MGWWTRAAMLGATFLLSSSLRIDSRFMLRGAKKKLQLGQAIMKSHGCDLG